jgi:hypothetical protein
MMFLYNSKTVGERNIGENNKGLFGDFALNSLPRCKRKDTNWAGVDVVSADTH